MKRYLIIIISIFTFIIISGCVAKVSLQDILDTIELPTEVYDNLDLKNEYSLNGVTAEAIWHSTASDVISSDGVIVVDIVDKSAILQLKLKLNDDELSKNFPITVKGNTDLLVLYACYNSQLNFPDTEVESDLELKTIYIQDGKEIQASWVSSNPEVISNTGKVTRMETNMEVTLTLTLTLNLAKRIEKFNFIVPQSEASLPVNYYHKAPLYDGVITGEAPDPLTPGCFAGAIYRKVVSSRDNWMGIEGLITLPEFTPDERRYDATKPSYYLDNPSIYMGGNAHNESDIGITWSIGHPSATNIATSKQGIAYRPFWRYITSMETGSRQNIYKNANVNNHEYYYFPGDKIRMSVFSPKANYMQMRIELIELTTIPKYVAMRDGYNLGDDFNRVFMTDPFPSEGMGRIKSEFKRVNAIDQVGNEGKATLNTNAKVENAMWHEVFLYRYIDDKLYKVPMTENRSASMTCPLGKNANGDFSKAFVINYMGVNKDLGGEVITLNPSNGTGKLYN